MNLLTKEIEGHWDYISPILSIRNEEEYDRATVLDLSAGEHTMAHPLGQS